MFVKDLDIWQEIQALVDQVPEALVDKISAKDLNKVLPKETELGVVHDPFLRRLWTTMHTTKTKFMELQSKAETETDEAKAKEFNTEADKIRSLAEFMRELFWIEIKVQFNAWHYSSIGIRKGWMLVDSTKTDPGVDKDGLKRILGLLGGLQEGMED